MPGGSGGRHYGNSVTPWFLAKGRLVFVELMDLNILIYLCSLD